jgi:hypothetical protein
LSEVDYQKLLNFENKLSGEYWNLWDSVNKFQLAHCKFEKYRDSSMDPDIRAIQLKTFHYKISVLVDTKKILERMIKEFGMFLADNLSEISQVASRDLDMYRRKVKGFSTTFSCSVWENAEEWEIGDYRYCPVGIESLYSSWLDFFRHEFPVWLLKSRKPWGHF